MWSLLYARYFPISRFYYRMHRKSARRLEISTSTAENSKRLAENSPSQGGGGLTLLPVRTMRLEVPERELSSNLRKAQVCSWE